MLNCGGHTDIIRGHSQTVCGLLQIVCRPLRFSKCSKPMSSVNRSTKARVWLHRHPYTAVTRPQGTLVGLGCMISTQVPPLPPLATRAASTTPSPPWVLQWAAWVQICIIFSILQVPIKYIRGQITPISKGTMRGLCKQYNHKDGPNQRSGRPARIKSAAGML